MNSVVTILFYDVALHGTYALECDKACSQYFKLLEIKSYEASSFFGICCKNAVITQHCCNLRSQCLWQLGL